jgi:murein L,D-transpeptidase YcbB/YkuD
MRRPLPRAVLLGLWLAAPTLAMPASRAEEATPVFDFASTQTTTLRDTTQAAPEKASPAPDQPAVLTPAPILIEPPSPALAPALDASHPMRESAPGTNLATALKQALDDLAREPMRTLAARREREAITAFYAARAHAPLWIDKDAGTKDIWTPAAHAALSRLEHADEDGLALKQGSLPVLNATTDASRAATDLALSLAVVAYGRQASGSRIDPQSIDKLITEKPEVADPARILSTVSAALDADAALRGFNPTQAGYLALREKLIEVRREKPRSIDRIAAGPTLKPGMQDPRVPLIRARFGLDAQPLANTADDLLYDTRVASAVADFQRSSGLPASGQLTTRTVSALSGGDPARLEAEIIANMERWRWRARGEAAERIEVNIPDYSVRVFHDNAQFYKARVIVGKPANQTPIFSNRMQFIEVNPYWNVPDSIIRKEMMPKLAEDPAYLQKLGYEVSKAPNGRMIVRQPPGERNALGRIKFMFPNQHAVYLHDTPTRALFANVTRAYSHGCVRLDQPFKFAEVVLGAENGWTEDRVRKLIGGRNQAILLPRTIDIHIGYYTAFVDETGKLQLREDIYGHSARVRAALGLAL